MNKEQIKQIIGENQEFVKDITFMERPFTHFLPPHSILCKAAAKQNLKKRETTKNFCYSPLSFCAGLFIFEIRLYRHPKFP